MESTFYQTLIPIAEELPGPRVVLHRHRISDAPDLFAALEESRQRLYPWLSFPDHLQTLDSAYDWLGGREAAWILREVLSFAIRSRDTAAYLGSVELHHINWPCRSFEMGYWLRDSAEGNGYMREAVRALANYALTALAANRVQITCDARNTRSAAVAERLGFILEGRLRQNARAKDGAITDTLVYAHVPGDPDWPTE